MFKQRFFRRNIVLNKAFLVVFLAIAFVAAFVGMGEQLQASQSYQVQNLPDGTKKFGNGELKYSEGIPVLKLSGTYYDMGLQYGVLMKTEFHKVTEDVNQLKKSAISALPWYQKPFAKMYLSKMVQEIEDTIPQKYRDELRGMADGSGLRYKDIVFLAGGAGLNPACTSILVKLDDRLIHGRNYDFQPYLLAEYPVIIEYNPEGKIKYTGFGIIGYAPVFQGVNKEGISITLNDGSCYKKDMKGFPVGYRVREMLEAASSLQDVDSIIRKYENEGNGWILTVGSAAERTGVVYDLFDDVIARSDFTEDNYKYVLNDIFSKQRYTDLTNTKKYLHMAVGEGEGNHARRYAADHFLAEEGIHNLDDMLSFLRNTDFYHYQDSAGTFSTINNSMTLHTLIFDVQNNAVYFAVAPGYAALSRMVKYDLDTSEITLFKEEDPRYAKMQAFPKWMERVQNYIIKNDYKSIFAMSDLKKVGLEQYVILFQLWSQDNSLADRNSMLEAADRLLLDYKDYGVLYGIKALLLKGQDDTKTIENAHKALQADILCNDIKIRIYAELADMYKQKNDVGNMRKFAGECVLLIDNLRTEYNMDNFKKTYGKMKKYAAGK